MDNMVNEMTTRTMAEPTRGTYVKTGVTGLASGALTAFLGINPITLGIGVVALFGPEVYRQIKLTQREENALILKQYKNSHTIVDPRTGHEWKFKRAATEAELIEYTQRYQNGNGEDSATILKSLGLIG